MGTAKSGGKLLAWLPCADKVIALWFSPDSRELRIADASGATPAQRMISSLPFRPRIQLGSPLHARINAGWRSSQLGTHPPPILAS